MTRTNSIEGNTPVSELMWDILSAYTSENYSYSIWRLPNSNVIHLAASRNPLKASEINLESSQPTFIFSPFDPSKEKIILPLDEHVEFHEGEITYSKDSIAENVILYKKTSSSKPKKFYSSNSTTITTTETNYKLLVEKAIREINQGSAQKIVPSRFKKLALPEGFDLMDTFGRLSSLYPHAMVSIFSSPLTGTWMGATPEMLVGMNSNRIFRTVAVAGTQRYEEGTDIRSISWTQKEIEEQALVERYIISCFKKIRLREYDEVGPKTIIAGNLLHLKTEFTVDMAATNFPQLGSIMLKLLHPTSAVCGMPLEYTLKFLKDNEGYDREYYSGYLGPVNVNDETNLFVNLRCMQLFDNEAIQYAGAGVTSDSNPENEFTETEMKMATLRKSIKK